MVEAMDGLINIDAIKVTCPVTGKKIEKFNRDHALGVGYESLAQYRKENNINYTTAAQQARQKLKYLYSINYSRWVVGFKSSDGIQYVTKNYVKDYEKATRAGMRSASKYPLGDAAINRHLKGLNPLAIFVHGTGSRWFGFDVDTKEQAQADTFKLINTLEAEGIPKKDIHISFSGSKGYHVEIFIKTRIGFIDWEIFARYIVHKAGLTGKAIEWRPTKTNGHAWKLPLTLHPKTKQFAGYCHHDNLEVIGVQGSHDYLLGIKQIATEVVLPILDRAKAYLKEVEEEEKAREQAKARQKKQADQEKRKAVKITNFDLFQTKEEKKQAAQKLIHEGLPGTGTRWKAMRNVLIPYLKIEAGMTAEGTREYLIEWCKREGMAGRTTTPIYESEQEINQLIENYYPKVNGFYTVIRDIEISRGDLDWVLSVTDRGGTRNARDLLWTLFLLSKAYAKRDGTFFAGYRAIQKLLSRPKKIGKDTIQKQRDWLVAQGYIEYTVPESSYRERKATIYKLLGEKTNAEVGTALNIIGSITFDADSDARKLLYKVTTKVYTPDMAQKGFKVGYNSCNNTIP